VSIANWIKGKVVGTIGPAVGHPYVRMEGAAGLPEVASPSADREPGAVPPTLIAAVSTFVACVFAAGKGGAGLVKPVNVHCAIVKPQTGVGPAGAVFTVNVSVAKLPVSIVPTKRWLDVLL